MLTVSIRKVSWASKWIGTTVGVSPATVMFAPEPLTVMWSTALLPRTVRVSALLLQAAPPPWTPVVAGAGAAPPVVAVARQHPNLPVSGASELRIDPAVSAEVDPEVIGVHQTTTPAGGSRSEEHLDDPPCPFAAPRSAIRQYRLTSQRRVWGPSVNGPRRETPGLGVPG